MQVSTVIKPLSLAKYPTVRAFTLPLGKGVERKGGCAERNLCRAGSRPPPPGSRAFSVHPASLLGGRRAPSAHTSVLSRALRFRYDGHACSRNPSAPFTALPHAVDSSGTRTLSTRYFPGEISGSLSLQYGDLIYLSIEKSNIFS